MKLHDQVYGTVEINSEVIEALIQCPPMQRLKGIGQFGTPDEFDLRKTNFSRYDHSVGVMLLLRRLGGSEEEQIAGLLHDVSHTAFSHTVDWVIGDGEKEDFQDQQHEQIIQKSEIPSVLNKFGFSAERIVDYHHFTLLEQDLPALCTDRVDYSLRELRSRTVQKVLPALTTYNDKIVFTDQDAAFTFAEAFLFLQRTSWGGEEPVMRNILFVKVLQRGIEKGIITFSDFWQDDNYVLKKLKAAHDPVIENLFSLLRLKRLTHLPKSNEIVRKKIPLCRSCDPSR